MLLVVLAVIFLYVMPASNRHVTTACCRYGHIRVHANLMHTVNNQIHNVTVTSWL